ncbi:MAG: hypothetical protein JXQ99_27160 [Hyphomicrobiaceae bacterium]
MSTFPTSFTSETDPGSLIIYGQVIDPGRVYAALKEQQGPASSLTRQYALVTDQMPGLRLSSSGWMLLPLDQRMMLSTIDELFLLCREKVMQGAPQFARPMRQFLESYLDAIAAAIDVNNELQNAPDDEIYTAIDWIFSSWLPLPNAHILLPSDDDSQTPEFAKVDVAFWQGARIVGVVIDGSSTPLKSERRKLDYLCAHHPHFDLVRLTSTDIQIDTFRLNMLPPAFSQFCDGLTLPLGPCPPEL